MKIFRCLLLILLVSLLTSAVCAEGLDFGSMSIDELQSIIDAATAELNSRKATPISDISLTDGGLVFEANNVSAYFDAGYNISTYYGSGDDESKQLEIKGYIDNQSDIDVRVYIMSAEIDGWVIMAYADSGHIAVPAGKKIKATFTFEISDANIKTVEEIKDFYVNFLLTDAENNDIYETGNLKIGE